MLLQELTGQCARRLGRIDAAGVGSEHVGVGLLPPFGSVDGAPGHRHALLLGNLGTEEEQRAFRHDPECTLGERVLDRQRRLGGLVVDHDSLDHVTVDAAHRILLGDPGIERIGTGHELIRSRPGQRRDQRDRDGRLSTARPTRCRSGRRRRRRVRRAAGEDQRCAQARHSEHPSTTAR